MPLTHCPADPCLQEHHVLMRLYAETQTRCSAHISAQQAEIARLQADIQSLRARAILQVTALDWERHARQLLQSQLDTLQAMHAQVSSMAAQPQPVSDLHAHSARATELLICQTGCVEDDDHWRQADHCKRTGKACLLALEPDALSMLHPTQTTPTVSEN